MINRSIYPFDWADQTKRPADVTEVTLRGIAWDIRSAMASGRTSGTTDQYLNSLTVSEFWDLVDEIAEKDIRGNRVGQWLNERVEAQTAIPESELGYRLVTNINPNVEPVQVEEEPREAITVFNVWQNGFALRGHSTEASAALWYLFAAVKLELEHNDRSMEEAIESAGQVVYYPENLYWEVCHMVGLMYDAQVSARYYNDRREYKARNLLQRIADKRYLGDGVFTLMHNWTADPQWADAPLFLFVAESGSDAQSKAQRWARYHSFDRDTVKARPATTEDRARLEMHNEYIG